MIFFLATLITSTIFITDRLEGIWDRTLVAGVSTTELLIAHIITQSTVMLMQCIEIVILAAFIFNTENHGDNFTVIFLLMLLGFSGMLYGLFISIFCDSHTMANFMATGSFYPMVILCGMKVKLKVLFNLLKILSSRYFLATRGNANLPSVHSIYAPLHFAIRSCARYFSQGMDFCLSKRNCRLWHNDNMDRSIINTLSDRT